MKKHSLSSLLWLRMARFVQRSNQLSNAFLDRYGLTAAQFDVLTQIEAHEPITQSELAEKLTVSRGGISRMLTRLEKDGLIQRDQEWKVKYISLTGSGREKLDEAYTDQLAFQSSMFDDVLTDAEKKQLYVMLAKLHKNSLKKQIPNV